MNQSALAWILLIKVSDASMEGSLSALSNRMTDLEKRVEEVEKRVSATEDNHGAYDTCIATMEKTMEQLQLKIPVKAEGNIPLTDFLQTLLPTSVALPADYPPTGD